MRPWRLGLREGMALICAVLLLGAPARADPPTEPGQDPPGDQQSSPAENSLSLPSHATQEATQPAPATGATDRSAPSPSAPAPAKPWSLNLTVSTYLVENGRDYAQPTFTADKDWFHFEARYNYEGYQTGSVWLGLDFSWGTELTLAFTPMVGVAFGDTAGVAPGYELTLTYGKLQFFTEGEFLFDTRNESDSYFYNWSQLSYSPVEWFNFGIVIQRTKARHTDFDIERGFLVGFTYKSFDFTVYCFDLGWSSNPTIVLSAGISF